MLKRSIIKIRWISWKGNQFTVQTQGLGGDTEPEEEIKPHESQG